MPEQRDKLRHVLAIHFHPKMGSPFWLARQQALGFNVPDRIRTLDALAQLGPMDMDALRHRPVEDFIPRVFHGKRALVTGETGGATGTPKTTAYFEEDFEAAFIRPFLEATPEMTERWRNHTHWLWVGPSGPHIIGKAAQHIARLTTGNDAFSVDFDPRWYRKLAPGTIAAKRYLEHVLEQAARIITQQRIGFLFTTPAVAVSLAERVSSEDRRAVSFIYLGGMAISCRDLDRIRDRFPEARTLSGYGNTLFGVCHQAPDEGADGRGIRYFPQSPHLVLRLVPLAQPLDCAHRLARVVDYGERGQVMMHRLTESCFLANVLERDTGIRIAPGKHGTVWDGIGEPLPIHTERFSVADGIY